ncbi:MAG: chemotaxis protein CheA [Spirochaetales bacterium]|nr:chemotaxis protein CheA [Spirochaetales bacterium]
MSDYLDPTNEELLKDFFEEAELQVEAFEQNVLHLENNPENMDAIDEMFRAAHTLKGGAATVEMNEITQFTHLVENVLDEMRSGNLKTDGDVIDILLNAVDIIKKMLRERLSGKVFQEDIDELTDNLNSLLSGEKKVDMVSGEKKIKIKSKLIEKKDGKGKELTEYELLELVAEAGKDNKLYWIQVTFNKDNVMNTVGGIQLYAAFNEIGKVLQSYPEFELLYDDNFYPVVDYYVAAPVGEEKIRDICDMPDIVVDTKVTLIQESKISSLKTAKTEKSIQEEKKEEVSDTKTATKAYVKGIDKGKITRLGSVLRVESKRIDELMNLVSEAVINKATFNQISTNFNELITQIQEAGDKLGTNIKNFFKILPQYFEEYKSNGKDLKTITRDIGTKYGKLLDDYVVLETDLKGVVTKFHSTAGSLGRITNELQEGVMRIRMVPVSQIFSRFPRLVRDLSKELNKNVILHTEGEETELDKSVIEDLVDPLIHCVRNSLDHGIESVEDRRKAGKSPEGNIYLRASNEGNMIHIEIEDDGKGIDIQGVRERAIKRGVIHPEKRLSDFEAFNLIFNAGFSTADKVTDVSGRGVGLDVVKKKIEKLNGSVIVWSEAGKGTKFTIKLPLTLAIIQGLLVKVGEEVYAIPITSVIESHRISPPEIKLIDNYEVFNLREEVVSIVRLNRLFRIPVDENAKYHYIVLVGAEKNKVGLMVDSLIGEEDVVIKPLKDKYSNSPGIAGATILGDGTVSLIIDVSQLLELDLKIEKTKRKEREARIL